jgi:HEAT repeat protein
VGACHGLVGANRDSWKDWWEFNKDEFLWDRRLAARRAAITSGSGRLLAGRAQQLTLTEPLPRSMVYTAIVPALLEVIADGPRSDEDPRVLDAAARSLGVAVNAPFDGPVVEMLIPLLSHEYDEVKVAATVALGLLGPGESGTLLELALATQAGERLVKEKEVPVDVRVAATLALGYADDPAAVLPLIGLVEDPRGQEAVVKTGAIRAMGLLRNERARVAGDYLLGKLADTRMDPVVRSAIPTALGRLGRADAVAPLMKLLLKSRHTDPCVLQSTVIGLGRLADLDSADVLTALMDIVDDDEDAPTRHFAIMSLSRIGARDARPQQHASVHQELQEFFARQLSRRMRFADRPWAGLATGVYLYGHPPGRRRLAEPLLAAYDAMNDPFDKCAFALGLGLAGVNEAASRIEQGFRDKRLLHRGLAALSLGFLRHSEAADALIEDLADERKRQSFRDIALGCLLMEDPQVTATATSTVIDHFDRAVVEGTRTELAGALEVLRVAAALPPLKRALDNEDLDELRRAWVCAAMERLAEAETLPWHSRLLADTNFAMRGDESLHPVR